MKSSEKILSCIAVLCAIVFMFSGCGGGGSSGSTGSGTVSALKVAEKLSIVDSQEQPGGSSVATLFGLKPLAVSDLPDDSDYNTDKGFVYVEERSAESFSIINEILCYMAQTRYDAMLNKGNYKAQIDVSQCENTKDSASAAGQESQNQSSGANATEYELWTVNSSRADNNSPHIVKVWVHEKAEEFEPAKVIEVRVIITESVSSTNPFGIFTMYFKARPENGTDTFFTGYLKSELDASGNVLLKFYNDGEFDDGNVTFTEKVTLNRSADGSSGSGSTFTAETDPFNGNTSESFDIAYNTDYFYRGDGSKDVCLSRTNPDITAWRYGLYYDENNSTAPGGRVTTNSGFPVKFVSGGDIHYGWAGFYGLWFPEGVSLSSGDTVYRQEYSPDGTMETAYTTFIVGGKLRRHTKKTLTLGEIANVPLMWHECVDQGEGNWVCEEYRVKWNSTAEKLYKTASLDDTNWVWKNIEPPEEVIFNPDAWDFNFYSESLGGSGRINLKDPNDPTGQQQIILSNTVNVVFHIEDTVIPGEDGIPSNLACFENCLDPSTINTESPYFTSSTWEAAPDNFSTINQSVAPRDLVAGANYIAYVFNSSTMELTYGSSPVVMTSNTSNQHGVWTGALFEPSAENLAQLACDWDTGVTCSWQAWDKLDTFYTWETGTEQWNKLTALQNSGSFVKFDPPISLEYTHTWQDLTTSKFYLEYNGFGEIHGIPGKCVDMDTGLDSDCWDNTGDKYIRWVPEFTIPDDSTVTDAVNSVKYYIKALEKEERMKSVDVSQCTGAGLSLQSYTLPDANLYQDPNIGQEPTVTDAPAVIGGVLQ